MSKPISFIFLVIGGQIILDKRSMPAASVSSCFRSSRSLFVSAPLPKKMMARLPSNSIVRKRSFPLTKFSRSSLNFPNNASDIFAPNFDPTPSERILRLGPWRERTRDAYSKIICERETNRKQIETTLALCLLDVLFNVACKVTMATCHMASMTQCFPGCLSVPPTRFHERVGKSCGSSCENVQICSAWAYMPHDITITKMWTKFAMVYSLSRAFWSKHQDLFKKKDRVSHGKLRKRMERSLNKMVNTLPGLPSLLKRCLARR